MKIPFCKWGLLLVVLLFIVLATGCTGPAGPAKPERPGPSQVTEEQPYPIGFQEGLSRAEEALRDDEAGPTPAFPVYFVQAKRIDSEGKAAQWIFGIRKEDKNYFVVVQSDRQVLQPFPFDLPEKEITPSSMIDPALFIGKNRQLFLDAGAREPLILPELELSEGFYTVTVTTGSGNAVLLFDAATGDPVG
jgi:hypothetical protein